MKDKSVPKYKNIDGHRYELASQDIGKAHATRIARELRGKDRYYLARVLSMKGSYRVYAKRLGFKKSKVRRK